MTPPRNLEEERVYVTDCEGPISKNDNAFELTRHFVPEGEKFYSQISRYDDVQADVVNRQEYKAGDTLKLIVPFLKAYNVTNLKITEFSARNIMLMPGAKEALTYIKNAMPSFIVSTSYEHYIRILCETVGFPIENARCTGLNIDALPMTRNEQEEIKRFKRIICSLPPIEIPEGATSIQDFSEKHRKTIRTMDDIFWREIAQMEAATLLTLVNPMGGAEKANAVKKIIEETKSSLANTMYVGDSITDVECLRLIREEGGVTVSFNGNGYAVREAEIAVLSANAFVIAIVANVFNTSSNPTDSVLELISNWSYQGLKKHKVNTRLLRELESMFPKTLPKAVKVTTSNLKKVVDESTAFRKQVRGIKVGSLG